MTLGNGNACVIALGIGARGERGGRPRDVHHTVDTENHPMSLVRTWAD
jgi:hypothetical protein